MEISIRLRKIIIALFSILGFIAIALLIMTALQTSLVLVIIVFILAYIFNPLLEVLQRRLKLNRSVLALCASLFCLLFIFIVPIFIIPTLAEQIKILAVHIPELMNLLNTQILAPINSKFNTNFLLSKDIISNALLKESHAYSDKFTLNSVLPIAKGGLFALSRIIDTILIPFVLFYVIKKWYQILAFMDRLIPRRYVNSVHSLVKDIDKSLSFYLRGQILVILVMVTYYVIALNVVGLPAATIIGIICGVLVFIPYVGYGISIVLVILFGLSDFSGMSQIIILIGLMLAGCLIENFIAVPFLIGDSIGLNPIMVIFALIICDNLFGLPGIIASLPLTAIGVVLFQHLLQFYFDSGYYSRRR